MSNLCAYSDFSPAQGSALSGSLIELPDSSSAESACCETDQSDPQPLYIDAELRPVDIVDIPENDVPQEEGRRIEDDDGGSEDTDQFPSNQEHFEPHEAWGK
uniref:Uncharacterized protein n=1 Tax=Steinernema glaseri TaxID=37863 RepID=A0A1I8AKI5_9BILA